MPQDAMGRHRRRVGAHGKDELAITQRLQGGLHRALGEACFIRDRAQAGGDWPPTLTHRATKQKQVDQKSRWLLIVSDQIAHEHINYVIVHWHSPAKTRHEYKSSSYTDNRTILSAGLTRSPLAPRDGGVNLPTMITHIKFVTIPARDQNRALDFYTDKLGFTIITDQPFDEKH